jgi:hypothetical protein
VNQDIDYILRNWEFTPGGPQARLIQVKDGRQVVQLRVDLGVLQFETTDRPDGSRPHGFATYFEYVQDLANRARKKEKSFVLTEEHCQETDREFLQFYQRRMCWLALQQYGWAIRDANHTLEFMDLVKLHAPNDDYLHAHEQYRGFVLFQRTQAAAAMQVEKNDPAQAVDEIRAGLDKIRAFFASYEREDEMDQDGMVQHLRRIEATLRERHDIKATMEEQLEQAIAAEDYERAARLRDAMNMKKRK